MNKDSLDILIDYVTKIEEEVNNLREENEKLKEILSPTQKWILNTNEKTN